MVSCFHRASCSLRLPFIVPSIAAACFRLVVVCKMFDRRPSMPRAQPISLFFSLLSSIVRPSKQWDNDPHTFHPGRVSSLTPPSPLTTTFGRLLCPPIKRQPSKAKGPPISLFFRRLIRLPKRRAAVLPTRSDPASPLLQRNL